MHLWRVLFIPLVSVAVSIVVALLTPIAASAGTTCDVPYGAGAAPAIAACLAASDAEYAAAFMAHWIPGFVAGLLTLVALFSGSVLRDRRAAARAAAPAGIAARF